MEIENPFLEAFGVVDADKLEISNLVYGGRACNKLGVIYHDKNYLLKFPGNFGCDCCIY
ncbi:MAG: hypothetical protein K2N87_08945 [Eubacterium sp.]|nr:hypothetical protein [Eubacterium sp.]